MIGALKNKLLLVKKYRNFVSEGKYEAAAFELFIDLPLKGSPVLAVQEALNYLISEFLMKPDSSKEVASLTTSLLNFLNEVKERSKDIEIKNIDDLKKRILDLTAAEESLEDKDKHVSKSLQNLLSALVEFAPKLDRVNFLRPFVSKASKDYQEKAQQALSLKFDAILSGDYIYSVDPEIREFSKFVKTKDFSLLSIEKSDLSGKNFSDAIFRCSSFAPQTSFENADLKNVDFYLADVRNVTSWKGAKINQKTLISLLPSLKDAAIEASRQGKPYKFDAELSADCASEIEKLTKSLGSAIEVRTDLSDSKILTLAKSLQSLQIAEAGRDRATGNFLDQIALKFAYLRASDQPSEALGDLDAITRHINELARQKIRYLLSAEGLATKLTLTKTAQASASAASVPTAPIQPAQESLGSWVLKILSSALTLGAASPAQPAQLTDDQIKVIILTQVSSHLSQSLSIKGPKFVHFLLSQENLDGLLEHISRIDNLHEIINEPSPSAAAAQPKTKAEILGDEVSAWINSKLSEYRAVDNSEFNQTQVFDFIKTKLGPLDSSLILARPSLALTLAEEDARSVLSYARRDSDFHVDFELAIKQIIYRNAVKSGLEDQATSNKLDAVYDAIIGKATNENEVKAMVYLLFKDQQFLASWNKPETNVVEISEQFQQIKDSPKYQKLASKFAQSKDYDPSEKRSIKAMMQEQGRVQAVDDLLSFVDKDLASLLVPKPNDAKPTKIGLMLCRKLELSDDYKIKKIISKFTLTDCFILVFKLIKNFARLKNIYVKLKPILTKTGIIISNISPTPKEEEKMNKNYFDFLVSLVETNTFKKHLESTEEKSGIKSLAMTYLEFLPNHQQSMEFLQTTSKFLDFIKERKAGDEALQILSETSPAKRTDAIARIIRKVDSQELQDLLKTLNPLFANLIKNSEALKSYLGSKTPPVAASRETQVK